ncbi:thioesterase family protein [Sphingobium tyrosinilyticum]|uniref:Thioesterase family protein n=1 Tax=Sphingobium tyrosinilyticum TaxID=2715436 RepID=A0ABV9F510_9SPHN
MPASLDAGSPAAFFRKRGELFEPTGIGINPWNGSSQNGVSLASLVAHVVDRVPAPTNMHVARLNIDIMGAVPMQPLTPVLSIAREGPRVQLVDLTLRTGGRDWVKASALRVRVAATPPVEQPLATPFPEGAPSERYGWLEKIGQNLDGIQPGGRWIRFHGAAVEGEQLSPLERVAMVADFGAGIAAPLPRTDWTLANLDITLHLSRLPRSEWLLIESSAETSGNGVGIIHNRFGDQEGMIGAGHQTIFLDRWQRPNPFVQG